jgi:penicillin-binding protein 2
LNEARESMLYSSHEDLPDFKPRIIKLLIVVLFAFSVLAIRLWYLQILKGEEFGSLSTNNSIRKTPIIAPRGMILDCKGEIIADIGPSFDLVFYPHQGGDSSPPYKRLSEMTQSEEAELKNCYERRNRWLPLKPVVLKRGLSRDSVANLETFAVDLPGAVVRIQPSRNYYYGRLFAHITGYVGEIDNKKLSAKKFKHKYKPGDIVGKMGIEDFCEPYLKGVDGGKQVLVDALGREIEVLRKIDEKPGNNVYVNIDLELQQTAWYALGDGCGAVVAIEPATGKILAMVSRPSFDPNIFSEGVTSKEWRRILKDPDHPLENKATRGQYPPGSIFKIITGAAALEEGLVNPSERIFCPGYFNLGRWRYRCWKAPGHGSINFHQALVESCDVYFYTLGKRLGIEDLSKWANRLGFGQTTGLREINESCGLIPEVKGGRHPDGRLWMGGETVITAIGQGQVLVTPLQVASFFAALANNGKRFEPYLIDKITDADGKIKHQNSPKFLETLPIKRKNLKIIRDALAGVVNEDHGTGRRAMMRDVIVAGKTGTAQVASQRNNTGEDEDDTPYRLRDHAWFGAFAPMNEPRIAVAVLVEHGGHGGSTAGPIAREVIEKYLAITETITVKKK